MANVSAFSGAMPVIPGGKVELGYLATAVTTTNVTATSFPSSQSYIGPLSVVTDGSPVTVEFFCTEVKPPTVAGGYVEFSLFVDGVERTRYWGTVMNETGTTSGNKPVFLSRRLAGLSAGTHTFEVRLFASSTTGTPAVYSNADASIGVASPAFLSVSKIVNQNDGLKPFWTPPIVTTLPSNPQFGDVVTYKHTATGNIGALMPMQYDGTSWKPLGTTTLCRWSSGSASQVVNSTNVVNITTGDYGSISFTPPWDGYYEFGIQMRNVQLNSGIGIYVYLSNANFTANYDVAYFEDANGYTYHTRIPITGPRVEYLYASNTYRWATQITYAAGNQGTLFTAGTAYIAAVSR